MIKILVRSDRWNEREGAMGGNGSDDDDGDGGKNENYYLIHLIKSLIWLVTGFLILLNWSCVYRFYSSNQIRAF